MHHDDGENTFIENDLFQRARDQNIQEQSTREQSILEKSPREHDTHESDEQERDKAELQETEAALAKFKPGYMFYLAFSALSVLALMVSLDGTSVSVALPVRYLINITFSHEFHSLFITYTQG